MIEMYVNIYDEGVHIMQYESWQIFQDELRNNEQLLWSGRPRQGIFFRSADLLIVPAGFFILFMAASMLSTIPLNGMVMLVVGTIWLIQGLFITFGRFFTESFKRGKIYYALTNKRILIITGKKPKLTTKSLALESLADISLIQKKDGEGIILFGEVPANGTLAMYDSILLYMGNTALSAFDTIPDARNVYNQIHQARENLLSE